MKESEKRPAPRDRYASVVPRPGRHTSEDVHQALFPEDPPHPRSLDELKDGIRRYVRKKHGGR